ncbi:MAG: UDP-N-acetylglucosamine 2-epimerase (hydrolyzing) [Oscillospiraceae bacterium]|nr:UDP-N-acetylglucosamine 2-epimerase (hydrolyzing) [Oscillospiraceae bacterium]
MKKLAVVTATRAEYGLLAPVIRSLRTYETDALKIELIVTGTHLSEQYGQTVSDIDVRIDHKIPVSVRSDTELSISSNQAEVLVKFTELFLTERYQAVLLLGDRYETLAVAIAAGNTRTPVFHLCGGDTTEGALDEWIRHSITKISYLHFVTNEESRKRVIQLGEDPARVFNYGSTSIDNILSVSNLTKAEALERVGLPDCRYALCTYHPVTMGSGSVDGQIEAFLEAVQAFPELEFIVTKSNADLGGARINAMLDDAQTRLANLHVFASLGLRRYLSLMKYAEFVLGNSSSGIVETPAFHVPTVDIGDRQRGRLGSESIIHCGETAAEIVDAIRLAMSVEHRHKCQSVISPYGDGHAAKRIAAKTVEIVQNRIIDLKKTFFDLENRETTARTIRQERV